VVIVAHAASYALTGRDGVLRVLVTATDTTRAARIAESEEIDAKKAGKRLSDSDKGRAVYLQRFYGVKKEQPTDYDLVVNTDRLTPDEAAATIVAAAGPRSRKRRTPAERRQTEV
jgi:cytidylate kinase